MTTITATKARGNLYSLINEVQGIPRAHPDHRKTRQRRPDFRRGLALHSRNPFLHSIPGMVDSIKQARAEGADQAAGELDW